MADRVGVINHGEIILVQEKNKLMQELGRKQLTLILNEPLATVPPALAEYRLELSSTGAELIYTYDTNEQRTGITALLGALQKAGIHFSDLYTSQSSLEEIFVDLVKKPK
jgi:ABC-2 type transport system ATP-binding protein